jgi:uncharacterized cysteine cluster protein YcgN (CxxCxxCC family)
MTTAVTKCTNQEKLMQKRFWETKTLKEMNTKEWESLCDGCALCCLISLEDEDTGERVESNVSCQYLDLGTCKCTDYANRRTNVPDCWKITPENIDQLYWMPDSCAYRLLNEGKKLFDWHPLISGDPNTVHTCGPSLKGEMVSEDDVDMDELLGD